MGVRVLALLVPTLEAADITPNWRHRSFYATCPPPVCLVRANELSTKAVDVGNGPQQF